MGSMSEQKDYVELSDGTLVSDQMLDDAMSIMTWTDNPTVLDAFEQFWTVFKLVHSEEMSRIVEQRMAVFKQQQAAMMQPYQQVPQHLHHQIQQHQAQQAAMQNQYQNAMNNALGIGHGVLGISWP